jgi:hypothetical protein
MSKPPIRRLAAASEVRRLDLFHASLAPLMQAQLFLEAMESGEPAAVERWGQLSEPQQGSCSQHC